MILFNNGLLRIDYNPATDIILVEMPNVNYDSRAEFQHALDRIVENTRNYDVKYMLVDARKSVIDLEPEEYMQIVTKFSADLKTTRLQKGARVVSGSADREKTVAQVVSSMNHGFTFKTFSDPDAAVSWLKS